MSAPAWLNHQLFPFQSRWIEIEGNKMHYVDEGQGEIILFVHGTPEWSFGYRDLIRLLKKDFRCIAIDHLGFGLSDKPANADYNCRAHARRLQVLIDRLQLKNITLVANDFGGGFAMSYALAHPHNVSRIVLFNTWMHSLTNDPHYATPARLLNTWFGKFCYLYLNFPVNIVMPAAFGDRRKLTKEIHRHYKKALPSARERIAAHTFSIELMAASEWWQGLWEQLGKVEHLPMLIFWGMKDKFVPPAELYRWQRRLPHARVITYADAGHFVQEEKAEEMANELRNWMT